MSSLVQSEYIPVRPPAVPPVPPRPVLARWQIVVLLALGVWLYRQTVLHLVMQWWTDQDFSHGFFVPFFSAFVIWQDRHRLAKLPLKPAWSGLVLLAGSLGILVLGQLGAELFLARVSLLLAGTGIIALFLGWNFVRALAFPLAFLLLMIPIPQIIFNQITFPLQFLASRVAAEILPMMGVPVLRDGNILWLPAMPLEVARACSGIRSLMSLGTLAVIYGYLIEPRVWIRVALAAASIPIAVAANSLRIIGTGLIVQYWDPEKAEGFYHEFSGILVFAVSLVMLYLFHLALRAIVGRFNGEER